MGTLNFERLGYDRLYRLPLGPRRLRRGAAVPCRAVADARGVRATTLIALGAAGAARWTGMAFEADPVTAALLQVLHAGSFGLVHLGTMQFLGRAVPLTLAATAQSLFAVAAYGLATGAVTFLAGPLFGAIGGYAYLLPAGLSLLALGLTLMLARVWNGSTLSQRRRRHEMHPARRAAGPTI